MGSLPDVDAIARSHAACLAGRAQVSPGRLQHACVDLRRGRGPGHRGGGPHRLLRRAEEPHPPGAKDGTHGTEAAGTHRGHSG